jgi:hypothetical protein
MALARLSTLGLAAVIDAPAIWHAAVGHDLPGETALLRYLIAVPVSAAMLAVFRAMTASYHHREAPIRAVSERLDGEDAPPGPDGGVTSG